MKNLPFVVIREREHIRQERVR